MKIVDLDYDLQPRGSGVLLLTNASILAAFEKFQPISFPWDDP
jgi:hypothetical protein